ncbi:hypothetical protein [Paraburkholderia sediminicola]|uniref:hypothetical protein n=1 Tax=Paraburkholderia sediminicola TaxID=458836 RepID=UPI0038BB49C0
MSACSARFLDPQEVVLRALFRWLIGQRYLLANPFAGIRVRGAARHSYRKGIVGPPGPTRRRPRRRRPRDGGRDDRMDLLA